MPFYGFVSVSWVWQDEINFSLNQNPGTVHDSYGVGNFSIGINDRSSDRYRVTLFVNNFTDENYRSGLADLGLLSGGVTPPPTSFHVTYSGISAPKLNSPSKRYPYAGGSAPVPPPG